MFLRSGRWCLRIMVPTDLQQLHEGRSKLVKALGTSDRKDAQLRAAVKRAEYEALFATQRARLSPQSTRLTPELVAHLGVLFRHELLSEDDKARANPHTDGAAAAIAATPFLGAGPTLIHHGLQGPIAVHALPASVLPDDDADPFAGFKPDHAQTLRDDYRRTLDGWKDDAAQGRLDVAKRAADRMARQCGVLLDWNTPDARALLLTFQRGMVDAAGALVARSSGEAVDTPKAPELSQPAGPPAKLRDVLAPWKASNLKRDPKTVRDTELALELFEQFTGNKPLSALTLAMGDDFRASLLVQNKAPKTAANKMNAVNGLLNYAADQRGVIERNPWAKLRIAYSKKNTTIPWSAAELSLLFGTDLFTAYALPTFERRGKRFPVARAGMDAAYWIPLLVLFTGARVSEVAQLRISDVQRVDGPDGPASIPILVVTNEPDDDEEGSFATSAKTDQSVRRVPIHRELLRLGFMDYVEAIARAGAVQVFPAIARYEGKGAGADLSTWFGEYRRELGIKRRRAGFHTGRHTVRTALADFGATDAQAFAIGGWVGARGPGNSVYLHGLQMAGLREVLDRLNYPGLVLPRVFTVPAWTPTSTEKPSTK
jgi:integrase